MTALTDGMTAVVFDFFGTLTPTSPPEVWAENAARVAAVLRVPADALVQALDDSFAERISGALGDVRRTVQVLADRLGVALSDEQLDLAVQIRREVQESMFTFRPEAVPVLRQLRGAGFKIGLVSDCTTELPDAWPKLPVADLVDAPVFSCLEGTRKPDPRLFRKVAAELEASPAQCLYIGDGGGRELTGATAVGMRAVLLAGPDWHPHFARDRELAWAGLHISSLAELCE
ncbi:MAG: HAD family hydrolase [Streptosporangiaceae bacterium]